jgi:hypothetical protein
MLSPKTQDDTASGAGPWPAAASQATPELAPTATPPSSAGPFSFDDVFEAELDEVHKAGELRGCGAADRNVLLGLSLSGGGIRSATFNLGILQALAELKILRGFDYLSTVSGGGYIGSWLVAWIKRAGLDSVEAELAPQDKVGQKGDEPPAIQWLRAYSNYLTPRPGLFTADTWTVLAVYLRNVLLNLVIICSAIVALLAIPWVAMQAVDLNHPRSFAIAGLALLIVAVCRVGFALSAFDAKSCGPSQKNIQLSVVLPLVLSAWMLSIWWAQTSSPYAAALSHLPGHVIPVGPIVSGIIADASAHRDPHGVFFGALTAGVCVIVLMAICAALARFWTCFDPDNDGIADLNLPRNGVRLKMAAVLLLAIFVPGALAVVLMCLLSVDFAAFSDPRVFATHVTVFGMPLFIGLFTLVIVLHLGLFGRNYPDERREWWSRVGAWLVIAVSAWIGLFVISLYAPSLFRWLFSWTPAPDRWANPKLWSTLAAWAATTAGGLMAGKSPNTGKAASDNAPPNRWLNLLARTAPIVFAVGLFSILSAALAAIIDETHSPGLAMIIAGLTAYLLSLRIDVDEFSMHHFYKNRLVRCYLGASAANRRANKFTGFDRSDDVRLATLANWTAHGVARPRDDNDRAYDGPYPILNTTLNLAYGEKLAWQQRKGASFIFTPRYCGFCRVDADDANDSYRPTAQYAKRGGLAIGTPLAVSGAAVSPNWGYHTSPTVAFLLTVFNVRLGWWLGNPSREKWQRTGPLMGLLYLVTELLGFANNRRKYVYLSDGGHFDNMGLYELVRRRCRFIVVCDGEEDHAYTFGGIGSAIRQCRADFGVEIEIDFDALRPKEGKRSRAHCAIGKIYYPAASRGCAASLRPMTGTLVYLKATLTGDEPADVLEFAARAREFPHQSTADQFFDESQFESYRRLGYHVGKRTFSPVATGQASVLSAPAMRSPITDRETFFVRMRQHWYASGAAERQSFSRHGAALDALFERQRNDARLRFLDAQIYPEWRVLQRAAGDGSAAVQLWVPKDEDAMREGFYFCNSLLQLMENVYVELDLESQYDNPDNGGWMNLFRHWAWSGMFRVTWSVSSPTYGVRFANFCREKLELSRGELHMGAPMTSVDALDNSSLSFLEQNRVRRAIELAQLASFSVTPFEIRVRDPRTSSNQLSFPVGFALTADGKLWYFRIQNHLRKMGLGRKALALAIGNNRVDGLAVPPETPEALKLWPADRVRSLRALHESAQRLACEHNLLTDIIEA